METKEALTQVQKQQQAQRRKARVAYWVSVLFPPFGLFIAAWYLMTGKPDAKRVALVCTIITAIMLIGSWLILRSFVASIPAEQMNQLQNVDPNELLKNYKELMQ